MGRMTTDADRDLLGTACQLAENCSVSTTAFSVGALIASGAGQVLATGYSREGDAYEHAEEAALNKLAPDDARLAAATLYSSLEPCSSRASRPRSCTQLVLDAGIPRVVFAWREPSLFVDAVGTETLRAAGCCVLELDEFAERVRRVNAHLLA